MKTITTLFYIAILSLLIIACKSKDKQTVEEDDFVDELSPPTQVEGIVLKKAIFSKELSANGKIVSARKVEVRSKITQPFISIRVKNGQWVKSGQLIAIQDTFELYHNLIKQKAQYERARLDYADLLLGQGYSIDTQDEMPPELRQNAEMRSGIILAKTELALVKDRYQSAFIKAPVSGQVADMTGTEGNYPANNGLICTIIDNKNLMVDFFILEEEASIVKTGQKVDVYPFYNEKVRQSGIITAINPTVDNGLIRVRAELNGYNKSIYDGITVKVHVKSSSKKCLSVPKEAVVLRIGREVVFTYDEGTQSALWNYVNTSDENSTHIVIEEGLKEGDIVIISGNVHLGHEVPCVMTKLE